VPVRLVTIDELEARLKDLGCVPARGWRDNGRLWKARDGRYFMVPLPEVPPAEDDPTNDPELSLSRLADGRHRRDARPGSPGLDHPDCPPRAPGRRLKASPAILPVLMP